MLIYWTHPGSNSDISWGLYLLQLKAVELFMGAVCVPNL